MRYIIISTVVISSFLPSFSDNPTNLCHPGVPAPMTFLHLLQNVNVKVDFDEVTDLEHGQYVTDGRCLRYVPCQQHNTASSICHLSLCVCVSDIMNRHEWMHTHSTRIQPKVDSTPKYNCLNILWFFIFTTKKFCMYVYSQIYFAFLKSRLNWCSWRSLTKSAEIQFSVSGTQQVYINDWLRAREIEIEI